MEPLGLEGRGVLVDGHLAGRDAHGGGTGGVGQHPSDGRGQRRRIADGAASSPVWPGRTMSGMPPTSKPTTGVPHAIASVTVWPNDSCRLGMTNTSAAE